MIYLIGGPPRCGKTTLARLLADRDKIPYFSIDHIGTVISPYIEASKQDESFPLRSTRQKVNNDNDLFHEKYSAEEIVNFYSKQASTLWPGIKNFIQYALDDEHDLILEGWQLFPEFLSEIASVNSTSCLCINYVYKSDLNEILSGLKKNSPDGDWVLRNTKQEKTFVEIAKMISLFGRKIEAEAIKYGFKTINTDFDFIEKISMIAKETKPQRTH